MPKNLKNEILLVGKGINEKIEVPEGIVFEGCHIGVQNKHLASFDSQSRFLKDDMRILPLNVDDNIITRLQERSVSRYSIKRNYYVFFNVGLRLRRKEKRIHLHVPIRIISFAVRSYESRWIRPLLTRIPRYDANIHTGDFFTMMVYFLQSFKQTQLLLSAASAVLYLLETMSLSEIDQDLLNDMDLCSLLQKRTDKARLSSVQRRMLFDALQSFNRHQERVYRNGLRYTVDAFMATHVLNNHSVYRINFISPETMEG